MNIRTPAINKKNKKFFKNLLTNKAACGKIRMSKGTGPKKKSEVKKMKVNSINLRALRNIFPTLTVDLKEDAFVQVLDVSTNAHFRRGEGGAVILGGELWGTLNDLWNLTVVDCELSNPYYPDSLTIWVQK